MAESASINNMVNHRYIKVNGNGMHYTEMGSGPTVLLLHGFPDIWYSFRYQIPVLAAAGFHVVVPDLRGFGQSEAPASVDKYTELHIAGDMIALLNTLQVKQALVVGHDWGSIYAANLCLMRPDRVKAVVFLSVPYRPSDPQGSPVERTIEVWGDQAYTVVFQKPGQAEALFAKSTSANILKAFFLRWHLSSTNLQVPTFFTDEDDEALPEWFTEEDLKFYADTFDRTGFTGGFNHYRTIEMDEELKSPWALAKIFTPSMTILGKNDFVYSITARSLDEDALKNFLPNSEKFVVLDAGHFMHQEMHEDTNKLLVDFLQRHKD